MKSVSEDASEVTQTHLAISGDGSTAPPPTSRRRTLLIALAVVLAVGLLATAGGASYLAYVNRERADHWQARANALQQDLADLNEILVARSDQLNERTGQANELAAKVQDLRRAITRSEKDVRSLERRQRQLAHEKAQVEDQRAAIALQAATLQAVAQTFSDCNGGLTNLLQAVVYGDYGWIEANGDAIVATCDQANAAFNGYRNDYAE